MTIFLIPSVIPPFILEHLVCANKLIPRKWINENGKYLFSGTTGNSSKSAVTPRRIPITQCKIRVHLWIRDTDRVDFSENVCAFPPCMPISVGTEHTHTHTPSALEKFIFLFLDLVDLRAAAVAGHRFMHKRDKNYWYFWEHISSGKTFLFN